MIKIRPYHEQDAPFLAAIYFHTIHNINAQDYSTEQVNAWAPVSSLETVGWVKKWQKIPPMVAVINDKIVGFTELEDNGHIDCFYCHHQHQRVGVGSALMQAVEDKARKNKINKLFAEVSITAKPFFTAQGFIVTKEQSVSIRGMRLTNYVMEKILFTQSYLFEADHFGFRPVVETDIDYILRLDADAETMHFFPGGARTRQQIENKIKEYIDDYNENGYGIFLVFDSHSGELIARAGFADLESGETEVGYIVLKQHWGKGYASRILKILLQWAKNHIKKDKIIAFAPIDHLASERVMQKADMIFSRKGIMKGLDCVIYEYPLC